MSTITPEKTHALLEKLAEYVMNELPTRKEMDAKLAQLESRLNARLEQKADKQDLKKVEDKIDMLLEGMDAQAGQLDIQRTEMVAVSKTLDVYNERLGKLEQHNFGYRVRDKEE